MDVIVCRGTGTNNDCYHTSECYHVERADWVDKRPLEEVEHRGECKRCTGRDKNYHTGERIATRLQRMDVEDPQ